jgi:hypothetical protein
MEKYSPRFEMIIKSNASLIFGDNLIYELYQKLLDIIFRNKLYLVKVSLEKHLEDVK